VDGRSGVILQDGTLRTLERELSVGRAPGNDIVLLGGGVSRRHARLLAHGGRCFVEDVGSLHGTFVNGVRLRPGAPHPLRHADRIGVGDETLLFSAEHQTRDPDDTGHFDQHVLVGRRALSPFQRDVVAALCEPWLAGGSLDDLPSNEQIAARLGTPGALESVKAALRRAYAKAGLAEEPVPAKRRKLCPVARRRGWI
jgi:pSer/pThr/pTyr-binding forkhead associated (FHA) protein